MKEYQIFAALKGDISAPFIWVTNPEVPSRSVAKITNKNNGKSVYCEILAIDKNYRTGYNEAEHTKAIKEGSEIAVINGWYRNCLGVEKNTKAKLEIVVPCCQPLPLRQIRAGLKHPDNVVRIACDLGVVSVALGLIGLALGGISLWI